MDGIFMQGRSDDQKTWPEIAVEKEDGRGRGKSSATNETETGENVSATFLMEVVERQEYRCYYSGVLLTPDVASLDHIVPLSSGGKHERDNIAIVHKDINSLKGTMTTNEFVTWCRRVAAWHA